MLALWESKQGEPRGHLGPVWADSKKVFSISVLGWFGCLERGFGGNVSELQHREEAFCRSQVDVRGVSLSRAQPQPLIS